MLDKYFIKEMIKPRIFYDHNIYNGYMVMDFKYQKLIIEDI